MIYSAHFIWFQGSSNIPPQYLENIKKFKTINPLFNVFIWSENELIELLHNTDESIFNYCINRCKHFIQKIDIYKWLILYKKGGLYLDVDIEVEDTIDIDFLNNFNNYKLILNYMQVWSYIPFKVVNNGIIWSTIGNEMILVLLKSINWDNHNYRNKDWEILETTGPFHLTRWINTIELDNILILDQIYFEGRPLIHLRDTHGKYTTHLHHSNWMESWLYIYMFCLKKFFFIIGLLISVIISLKIYNN